MSLRPPPEVLVGSAGGDGAVGQRTTRGRGVYVECTDFVADSLEHVMAGKSTLTFTAENFEQEVLKSNVPVLVDFWAEWCGPCKVLGPTIDALADGYGPRAKVGKLNVDEHPAVAARYGVRSIPTVILFVNGAVQDTVVGVHTQQQYVRRLEAFTGSTA